MKYAIIGAAGNVSRLLVKNLLQAGHQLRVIGRNATHLTDLARAGAQTAIGSVEDPAFVEKAFEGVDAAFTLCPADFTGQDVRAFHEMLGKNYAEAIRSCGLKYVVNLSSVGAHLSAGAGPVSGLYRVEQALNNLQGVNILHLRACYFVTNFFGMMDMIRHRGILGSNFSFPSHRFPVSHPTDTAAVAAGELMNLDFSGHSFRYVASDEVGTDDIATAIGKAIGMTGLRWTKFSEQQALEGLQQAGLPPTIAASYVEMFSALDSGKMTADYWKHHPQLGKIKLSDFAKDYRTVWNQKFPQLVH